MLKEPGYFLQKESCINSDIYCEQVLDKLGLPFYKHFIQEKCLMIQMDDETNYHTLTKTVQWHKKMGLNCMNWSALSPDLKLIEILCRIIEMRFGVQRH